jgi:hypothetical protein
MQHNQKYAKDDAKPCEGKIRNSAGDHLNFQIEIMRYWRLNTKTDVDGVFLAWNIIDALSKTIDYVEYL